jgi:hypothetical protein
MDKAAIKQQAFAWPPVPHRLKNSIPPLNPTVVKELVTSRHLESNMSPTQYRNWRAQLQSNSDFFTKLLTKHASVDEPFLTALYNGVVFQSEAQVVATQKLVKKLLEQNAVVFQPMKTGVGRINPTLSKSIFRRSLSWHLNAEIKRERAGRPASIHQVGVIRQCHGTAELQNGG